MSAPQDSRAVGFTTERLTGRKIEAGDFADLCALHRDRDVMYWIHGALDEDEVEPETREFLEESLAHWRRYGFGVYMMTLRDTGEFAGRVAIRHAEIVGRDEVELAWQLPSGLWGRGLATEAARALLVIAFDVLALPDVVAFTRSYNQRSRRVMEKLGMRLELEYEHEGEPQVLYRLVAAQYSRD
jgi:RimJ/RimL family protein N-acetyltransferase